MSPNQKLPVRFRHGLHGLLDEWFSQGSAKSRRAVRFRHKPIKKSKTMNYPEQQMLKILNRDLLSNPMYVINNLHIYDWESDFLAITRSLYAYEVEVKMSKQDFFNDFKKDKKHKVLKDGIIKVGGVISYPPNYFYYACPPNMIDVSEVPSYAGLIYVDVSKNRKNVVKVAPLIHRQKFDVVGRKLVDKFYYNMLTWKKRAISNVYADPAKEKREGRACRS